MSEEFAEITENRRKFLKAVYDLARGRPTAHVSKADVAFRLGIDVGNREGFDEFMAIVQYFDDLGCIRTFHSGAEGYREYGDLRITGQGIRWRRAHASALYGCCGRCRRYFASLILSNLFYK